MRLDSSLDLTDVPVGIKDEQGRQGNDTIHINVISKDTGIVLPAIEETQIHIVDVKVGREGLAELGKDIFVIELDAR